MRKYLLAVLAVCLLLVGILVSLTPPRPCPVTKTGYERIEKGMSLAQVEEILGGPEGDYRTRPVLTLLPSGVGLPWAVWQGDAGTAEVSFDRSGSVTLKRFLEAEPPRPGLIETLRWRLERRWDRLWGR
jgi:hypothetical protein